jgi:hypothetical protein
MSEGEGGGVPFASGTCHGKATHMVCRHAIKGEQASIQQGSPHDACERSASPWHGGDALPMMQTRTGEQGSGRSIDVPGDKGPSDTHHRRCFQATQW